MKVRTVRAAAGSLPAVAAASYGLACLHAVALLLAGKLGEVHVGDDILRAVGSVIADADIIAAASRRVILPPYYGTVLGGIDGSAHCRPYVKSLVLVVAAVVAVAAGDDKDILLGRHAVVAPVGFQRYLVFPPAVPCRALSGSAVHQHGHQLVIVHVRELLEGKVRLRLDAVFVEVIAAYGTAAAAALVRCGVIALAGAAEPSFLDALAFRHGTRLPVVLLQVQGRDNLLDFRAVLAVLGIATSAYLPYPRPGAVPGSHSGRPVPEGAAARNGADIIVETVLRVLEFYVPAAQAQSEKVVVVLRLEAAPAATLE